MTAEKKHRAKTQTLSLRLDPKTRFVLEFMARLRGQSITMVVERAIKEAAEKDSVVSFDENDFGNDHQYEKNWSYYWDPSEGVRTLKLISDSDYPTTYDEDELLSFVKAHWEFFYTDKLFDQTKRHYIEILWQSIDKYLQIWREKKSNDYWAAGNAMRQDLVTANVEAPLWPRISPPNDHTQASVDDIPF